MGTRTKEARSPAGVGPCGAVLLAAGLAALGCGGPRTADLEVRAASLDLAAGRGEAAEAGFRRALDRAGTQGFDHGPRARAHAGLARVLAGRGDFEGAREHLGKALPLLPDDLALRVLAARLALRTGEGLEAALDHLPPRSGTAALRARLERRLGRGVGVPEGGPALDAALLDAEAAHRPEVARDALARVADTPGDALARAAAAEESLHCELDLGKVPPDLEARLPGVLGAPAQAALRARAARLSVLPGSTADWFALRRGGARGTAARLAILEALLPPGRALPPATSAPPARLVGRDPADPALRADGIPRVIVASWPGFPRAHLRVRLGPGGPPTLAAVAAEARPVEGRDLRVGAPPALAAGDAAACSDAGCAPGPAPFPDPGEEGWPRGLHRDSAATRRHRLFGRDAVPADLAALARTIEALDLLAARRAHRVALRREAWRPRLTWLELPSLGSRGVGARLHAACPSPGEDDPLVTWLRRGTAPLAGSLDALLGRLDAFVARMVPALDVDDTLILAFPGEGDAPGSVLLRGAGVTPGPPVAGGGDVGELAAYLLAGRRGPVPAGWEGVVSSRRSGPFAGP